MARIEKNKSQPLCQIQYATEATNGPIALFRILASAATTLFMDRGKLVIDLFRIGGDKSSSDVGSSSLYNIFYQLHIWAGAL